MKITVLQENLKGALTSLQKAIPSKPQLPILSSIYVQAHGDSLTLSATDLYLGIKSTIPAKVETEGSCVIPGDIFKNLVFSFSAGEIVFEQKETSLVVQYEKSKSSLPYQSAEEYPQFPEVKGEKYTLSKDLLQKIEKYITFSAASDQTRPVLTSLLFSFQENQLEIAATDGFRLATFVQPENNTHLRKDLLIPVKALSEVFRMMNQVEGTTVDFTVAEELKQVLFIVDGVQIYVRLIEGEYPPYKKIIPQEFAYTIALDGGELTSQVKRAFLFARDASNIVKFILQDNILKVYAHSPAFGEYTGEIPIQYSGETQEVAFNAMYLLDFLNVQKENEILFSMNESLKPVAFKVASEPHYIYVVMPFRTNRS